MNCMIYCSYILGIQQWQNNKEMFIFSQSLSCDLLSYILGIQQWQNNREMLIFRLSLSYDLCQYILGIKQWQNNRKMLILSHAVSYELLSVYSWYTTMVKQWRNVYFSQLLSYDLLCLIFLVSNNGKNNRGMCENALQGSKLIGTKSSLELSCGSLYRERKDVLFDIHNTFMKLMKMQLGKILISSPG